MKKYQTLHQGDINFCPLEAFGKSAKDVSRGNQLRAHKNRLLIQEGEITGHHHGVWFMPQPVMLRDDGRGHADAGQIASEVLDRAATGQLATARLYQDESLAQAIGLDARAPVVGFLICDEEVTIRHASEAGSPTGEHADIRFRFGAGDAEAVERSGSCFGRAGKISRRVRF